MSVRVTDDGAAFIDRQIAEGTFTSRADYLNWLVAKESMRQRALQDITRLRARRERGYHEFDELHTRVAAHPLELD